MRIIPMKRVFTTLLLLLISGISFVFTLDGKEQKFFTCQVRHTSGKDIFACGETISFQLKLQYPEGYKICAWSVYAYERNLPENFAKITKRKVGNANSPKWSSVGLKKIVWLPGAMRTKKDLLLQFGTAGFPPGDYRVTVSAVFQGKNKAGKMLTLYRAAPLSFSLEAGNSPQ